ncbi:TetR family transcriptional regulator [Mycobacterium sp. MS1601]|uniref:TetR/AcrR family transcriptional regulator n=1 Tax=Mycobacterium sp. MS1601 TaxID=1936029 RepID=UPI0009793711|nr:TetR/AcrR family transcriptional regulator [Mycobacterium sp. MS1601]AQA01872.1 TetR family transcriptional regulator [Mycobacterium sp. MS1601]
MPRVKQRTPELRDRVLAVAVDVLCEDGASGLTTRRVAERAATSVPAIYELFTDKAGLVRQVYFEGFRRLGRAMAAVPETEDAVTDLEQLIPVFRQFCLTYPALARVMFSRPFQDLGPGPAELTEAPSVRDVLLQRVRRCVDSGRLHGDPVDIAHVLLALAQGLAVQEGGHWLGNSQESVDRRWRVGVASVVQGFRTPETLP